MSPDKRAPKGWYVSSMFPVRKLGAGLWMIVFRRREHTAKIPIMPILMCSSDEVTAFRCACDALIKIMNANDPMNKLQKHNFTQQEERMSYEKQPIKRPS